MQQLGYRMEELIFTLADQNFFFNEIEVRKREHDTGNCTLSKRLPPGITLRCPKRREFRGTTRPHILRSDFSDRP